jgi:hypothetical protein
MAQYVPAMTGAELQAIREYLGLSTKWLADYLDVGTEQNGERKIVRWEDEKMPVPDHISGLVDDLYQEADTLVRWLSAEYRWRVKRHDGDGVVLKTYRTDYEFQRALRRAGFKGVAYPSRWHRMLCARVIDRVPGVILQYDK